MPRQSTMQLGRHSVRYLRYGQGRPLIFLQGFGIKPEHYSPLLKSLSDTFEVIAPDVLRGRTMRAQPRRLSEHAELLSEFIACLGLGPHSIVGHSMGGAIAYTLSAQSPETVQRVVGLNPVIPNDLKLSSFVGRSIVKSANETTGRHGGLKAALFAARFHGPFLANTLRGALRVRHLIDDVRRFSYDDLNIPQPALMLFAEEDEYFNLTPDLEDTLIDRFDDLTVERLAGWNHDWPIFHPERAADAIARFLNSPD